LSAYYADIIVTDWQRGTFQSKKEGGRPMINESNFIVRRSGRKENSYYIDYSGAYKITEIAKVVGIDPPALKEKYMDNGASYDEELDVYYFSSIESAKKTIADILKGTKSTQKGRLIFLTEREIECIRKALINEESNTIHVKSRIKDGIFKKLNG